MTQPPWLDRVDRAFRRFYGYLLGVVLGTWSFFAHPSPLALTAALVLGAGAGSGGLTIIERLQRRRNLPTVMWLDKDGQLFVTETIDGKRISRRMLF